MDRTPELVALARAREKFTVASAGTGWRPTSPVPSVFCALLQIVGAYARSQRKCTCKPAVSSV